MISGLQWNYFCADVWTTQNVPSPVSDTLVAVDSVFLCVIAGSSKCVAATYRGENGPTANYHVGL